MIERNFMSEKNKFKSVIYFVLSILLFVWPLLFVGRGIDFSDTSYYLANYKWAFDVEGLISPSTGFSNITGALIYRIIPEAHLLVFRILDVLLYAAVIICVRRICTRQEKIILVIAMLGGAFCLKDGPMTLSYNSFSVLNFALAMFLLLKGLDKKDNVRLILSGFIAGINVYFRVPNLMQISMVLAVFLYGWKEKWSGKEILTKALAYFAGYFAAIVIGFGLMCMQIGVDRVLSGYLGVADMGADSSSPHGVWNMLKKIFEQFTAGIKYFAPLFVSAALLSFLVAKAEHHSSGILRLFDKFGSFFAVIGGGLYGFALAYMLWPHAVFYILMSVALLIGAISLVFVKQQNSRYFVWAWFLIIAVGCMASGTDIIFAQFRSIGVLVMGLMVSLLLAWREFDRKTQPHFFSVKIFANAVIAFLLVLIIYMPAKNLIFEYTYRDASYPNLTEQVDVPELKGMHTTPERAAVLDAFCDDVEKYGLEDYQLAIAGHFSTAYFISDCEPFFGSTWPDLKSFSLGKYKNILHQKLEQGILPAIAIVDSGNGVFTNSIAEEKYNLLMELTVDHEYQCVHNDDSYKLYVPVI